MAMARLQIAMLLVLTLFLGTCAHPPARETVNTSKPAPHTLDLPREIVTLQPSRDDLTVGAAILLLYTSHPQNISIETAQPMHGDINFIYLKQIGKNQFELPAITLDLPQNDPKAFLCLSLKLYFNEITNMYDSDIYEKRDDRYSMISYVQGTPEPVPVGRFSFTQNKVPSLADFESFLSKPIPVRLKSIPLKPEWGRYPILGPPPLRATPAEVDEIQKLATDRSEKFIIAIFFQGATRAQMITGQNSYFRSEHSYMVDKKDNRWQITSVQETQHTP
jgi:hypothetical protein